MKSALSCALLFSAAMLSVATVTPAAHAEDLVPWRFGAKASNQSPDILALRLGGTKVEGASDSAFVGAQLWQAGYSPATRTIILGRLGGGTAGAEGALAVDFAFGGRAEIGEKDEQGFFLRAGMRGHYIANDTFIFSLLEVPQAQTGFQLLVAGRGNETPLLFEVGVRGSFAGVGRFIVDDARRVIRPAAAGGGHVAFGYGLARLEASYTQVFPNGEPTDVLQMIEGTGCVHIDIVGICTDARWISGRALPGAGRPSEEQSVLQLGLFGGLWL